MEFIIGLMGLIIVLLLGFLWGATLDTVRLETELRMLRERYKPDKKAEEPSVKPEKR